ncbi:MAG TPA: hypothetical protein VIV14_10735 [Gammaproteobacteria bacterium]
MVAGSAVDDPDFVAGGDRIRYRVPLGAAAGPLEVSVALRFQTIGYRRAENLRAYDAPEPQRFVRFYTESAGNSAVTLASDALTVDY